MRITNKPAFDSAEEIEIVSHYDLLEKAILANVLQILDDGVLVLIIEGIREGHRSQ